MRRWLLLVVSSVMVLTACHHIPQSPETAKIEQDVAALVNSHRAANKKAGVGVDNELTVKARGWARSMAEGRCGRDGSGIAGICHSTLSDGVTNWTWLGENVGMCSCAKAGVLHQNFVNSPPHNAIMLDGRARWVGVGVWRASNGYVYIAEVFKG
jgi:uncharacterized protein YkwD